LLRYRSALGGTHGELLARPPNGRTIGRRYRTTICRVLMTMTAVLGTVTSLTVGASPASAATGALSQPVKVEQITVGYKSGKAVNVTFTRPDDRYAHDDSRFELAGEVAPLLKVTFDPAKPNQQALAYFFTDAKIIILKIEPGAASTEVVTWQFKSMRRANTGVKYLGPGDYLQSRPNKPYP